MAQSPSGKRRRPPCLSLSREFTPEQLYEDALFSPLSQPRSRTAINPLASSDAPNLWPKFGHSSSPSLDWKPATPITSTSRRFLKDGVQLPLLPLTDTILQESIGNSQSLQLQSSVSGLDACTCSDPFVSPGPGVQGPPFDIVDDVDEQSLSPGCPKCSQSNEADTPSPNSFTSFLHKPSTPSSPGCRGQTDTRFPRRSTHSRATIHPFGERFRLFEAPQWRKLTIHIGLCGLAYPFLQIFVLAARGKNLFWARLLTGAGCGMLGLMLAISLLKLARRIIEAASELDPSNLVSIC